MFDKVVVVVKETPLQGLKKRFGTIGQAEFVLARANADFDAYLSYDDMFKVALDTIEAAIPKGIGYAVVESQFLATYQFDPNCLVVTVGPDGLVVNTAKYLHGQPILAVNPDPETIDGVLASNFASSVAVLFAGWEPTKKVLTMAEATMPDGQTLLAVNDLFIGHQSHQSARYEIEFRGETERQSSSGIIVSTGTGSTGWRRSILEGAANIMDACGDSEFSNLLRQSYQFPSHASTLSFSVREPFVSKATSSRIGFAMIESEERLVIRSEMPSGGVIFSDGVEADYLAFNSGTTVEIGLSNRRTELLV